MTTTPHGQVPEALRLADRLDLYATGDEHQRDTEAAAAERRRLHARIAELEAQLSSSGFTAADMATASAQGFRDGVASIAANAEGPVVNRATVIEWLDANDIEVTDRQLGGLFHFSAPPTAQAEGWQSIETAPKEGVFLVFMQDEVRPARRMQVANWHPNVKIVGGLFAFDCAKVTHWRPLPPPPTSAEEVEHG